MKFKDNKKILAATALATCSALTFSQTSNASDWDFSLAPLFLWGQSIDGTSKIGPSDAELDLEFKDDIFENLDTAFTVHFEAVNDDLTFFFEYQYTSLDPEGEKGPVKLSINFDMQQAEIGSTYAFAESDKTRWEFMLGLRWIEQEIEVSGNLQDLLPEDALDSKGGLSAGDDWIHPFMGVRVFRQMSERWSVIGRADYGYSNSDNTAANASLLFDYRFKDWGSFMVGYRIMDYDYEQGSGLDRFGYDATNQGPLLGLNIHW